MNSPSQLFGELVAIHILVKLHHWKVSKVRDAYSTHVALGELYDALTEQIDTLVETCQGKHGTHVISVKGVGIEIGIIEKLKLFTGMLELAKPFGEKDTNTYLYNQIDEIVSTFYKTIYKLENLRG